MADAPVIAITGASRGAGRGLAQYFADKGWRVHGASRTASDLVAENYAHTCADLSDETQTRSWLRGVRQASGRIDVLLCNAGVVKSSLLTPMLPTDLFTEFYESSFKTTFLACREASKLMLPQRAGRIITIGSTMTIVHEPGTAAYSANKAAIVEFTKVLARELAAHNITCNTIAPSLMNTPSSEAMGEEWRGRMLAMQTIRRPVEIAEIGGIVEFLASPQAACLTGQVLSTCFVS